MPHMVLKIKKLEIQYFKWFMNQSRNKGDMTKNVENGKS